MTTLTHRHGKTASGTQRYRCPSCDKKHSANGLRGRPSIGARAMTNTERSSRRRERLRGQKQNTKED